MSRLREEHGVLLVARHAFDMDGFVRVGFGSERAHMDGALAIIGAFFDALLTHAG